MALIDGLISHFSFNSNANDSHGTNHGTGTSVSYVASQESTGVTPATANGVVTLGAPIALAGSFTVGFWLDLAAVQTVGVDGFILADSASPICGLMVKANSSTLAFRTPSGTLVDGPPLDLGRRYIIFQFDGVLVRWFVDGAAITGFSPNTTITGGWNLGKVLNGGATNVNALNGVVDGLDIWNRVLSNREVRDMFNVGAGVNYPLTDRERSKTATVAVEYRWRRSDENDRWIYERSSNIGPSGLLIPRLTKDVEYVIQVRSVGANGLYSEWIEAKHTITNGNVWVPAQADVLTATAVADGADLSWTIEGLTSLSVSYEVERAPDSGGFAGTYALLATTRATAYHDAFTTGSKYWYRVRTRTTMAVASAYTNEVSVTGKTVSDGADVTGSATLVMVNNPTFEQGDKGWTKGPNWTISSQPGIALTSPYVATKTGAGGSQLVNTAKTPVEETSGWFMALVYYRRAACDGALKIGVRWLDAASAEISTSWSLSENGGGATDSVWRALRVFRAQAAAGAVFAQLVVDVSSAMTTGSWHIDNTQLVQTSPWMRDLDDLANGTVYGRIELDSLLGGKLVKFFRDGSLRNVSDVIHRTLDTIDNIGDGTTYGKPKILGLSDGYPKTDTLVDGTYARVKATMLTTGEITSVKRGANVVALSSMFQHTGVGSNSLDDVTDGTTHGKVKNTQLTSGEVTSVKRGANLVTVSSLFQTTGTGSDTLDAIADGATHGKVKNTMLTAGEVTSVKRGVNVVPLSSMFQSSGTGADTMDAIGDGATYAKIKGTMLTTGEITSIKRGANLVAVSDMFQKSGTGSNSLDDVANGASYAKVLGTMLTAGEITSLKRGANVIGTSTIFQYSGTGANNLDDVPEGVTNGKVKLTQLTAGEVTSVKRGANLVPVSSLFQTSGTGSDTLDAIANGASYAKVLATHLSAGVIANIGSGNIPATDLFRFQNGTPHTLDNIANGASYGKVNLGSLSSGDVNKVHDGTAARAGSSFFQYTGAGAHNLSHVTDGGGFRKVSDSYIDSSNRITNVYHSGALTSVGSLFRMGTDVIGPSNLDSFAATLPKIRDGKGFRPYDEMDGPSINVAGRITALNNVAGQFQGDSAGLCYRLGVASNAATPYFTTNLKKGYSTHVVLRGYFAGSWPARPQIRFYGLTSLNAVDATVITDGPYFMVEADLSVMVNTDVIRVYFLENPNSGTGYLYLNYMATGTFAPGVGNMYSSQGKVGVGVYEPLTTFDVATSARVVSTGTYARLQIKSTDNEYYLQSEDSAFSGFGIYDASNSAWRVNILKSNGSVGIGHTNPRAKLEVFGTGTGSRVLVSANDGDGESDFGYGFLISGSSREIAAIKADYTDSGFGGSGQMLLQTRNAGTLATRMVIDGAGAVGIGNGSTAPSAKLHVVGGVTDSDGVAMAEGQLVLSDSDHTNGGLILGYRYNSGVTEYAKIQGRNASGAAATLVLQGGGGKVGIGTNTPDGLLHVKSGSGSGGGNGIFRLQGDDPWMALYKYDGTRRMWFGYGESAGTANLGITNEVSGGAIKLASGSGGIDFHAGGGDVVCTGVTRPSANNTYTLGTAGNAWSDVWCNRGAFNGSDERIKNSIVESDLGLDFILSLTPRRYKMNIGGRRRVTRPDGTEVLEAVPGVRPHYGFVAQEVKAALGTADFAGYAYDQASDSHWLSYEQFIAPLVKAVQELTARVVALEATP